MEGPAEDSHADLLATIHEKIIPQLVLAHGLHKRELGVCSDSRLPPTAEEVAAFAEIATREDLPSALTFVQDMASQGVSVETLLLELIAPAARFLGEQWTDDLKSFTEVSVGLGTLQQVVHILGPSFAPDVAHRGFVVLVAPQPEQHTLGIYLLGEFLRRAGWGVQVAPSMSEEDLLNLVSSEEVAMVGISISNSDLVEGVKRLVAGVKKCSQNPEVIVMVGGAAELSSYAEQVDAVYCRDARAAVLMLDQHVRSN